MTSKTDEPKAPQTAEEKWALESEEARRKIAELARTVGADQLHKAETAYLRHLLLERDSKISELEKEASSDRKQRRGMVFSPADILILGVIGAAFFYALAEFRSVRESSQRAEERRIAQDQHITNTLTNIIQDLGTIKQEVIEVSAETKDTLRSIEDAAKK